VALRWVSAVATLVVVGAGVAHADPKSAGVAPGMDRLRNFLERVDSMRASFRQEVVNEDQRVIEEARGQVVLKRPGRFRWDYEQPYKRVVVSDGKRLSLYEADLEQVTVRPLAAGLGETPAALLSGERDILERFEYIGSWSGQGIAWVRLKPRAADPDFDSVAVGFSGDKPVQFELKDRLGQQTRLYLSDIRMNVAVADEVFRFEAPPGVDVIREGEL
jgi:outer membrane lipoprotein carrier protein